MSIGYKNNFEEINPIGNQNVTTIFEARSLNDNKLYAIKKIPFNVKDESAIVSEIKAFSKLDHNYVIPYIDIWIQNNYYLSNSSRFYSDTSNILLSADKTRLMHLQMNYCELPLDKVIKLLNYSTANVISPKKYSIASEIFLQLLECINYLHTNNPAIIHKNLKSENIMLIEDSNNRNVRLTDFGLSCYYDVVNEWHSTRTGVKSNCPPEVTRISYTYKTDMYSLGIVLKELFNIDIEKEFPVIKSKIHSQYGIIRNICLKCLSPTVTGRPSCEEILNTKDTWVYKIPKTKTLLSEIKKLETKTKLKDEAIGEIMSGTRIIERQKLLNKPEDNIIAKEISLPYNFRHIVHIGHNLNNPNVVTNINSINDKEKFAELYAEKLAQENIGEMHTDIERQKLVPIDNQLQGEGINTDLNPIASKRIASNVELENMTENKNQSCNERNSVKNGSDDEDVSVIEPNICKNELSEEYRIETHKLDQQSIILNTSENNDNQTSVDDNPNIKKLYCNINKFEIIDQNAITEQENTSHNTDTDTTSGDIKVSSPFNFVHILHIGHDSNNNSNQLPLMDAIASVNQKEKLTEIYFEKLSKENEESVNKDHNEEHSDHIINEELQNGSVKESILSKDELKITIKPLPRKTITSTVSNSYEQVLPSVSEKLADDDKQAVIDSNAIKCDSVADDIFEIDSQLVSQSSAVNETPKPLPPPIAPRTRISKITSVNECD